MRARFGIKCHLEYYDAAVLSRIVQRSAQLLSMPCNEEAASEIASRSRGTPRIANALLRRVRDFAQVKGSGRIDMEITQYALQALNIDQYGLDEVDNKLLNIMIDKFGGGPVGLTTIATALGEDAGTVEEVYEPFLIKEDSSSAPRAAVRSPTWPIAIRASRVILNKALSLTNSNSGLPFSALFLIFTFKECKFLELEGQTMVNEEKERIGDQVPSDIGVGR